MLLQHLSTPNYYVYRDRYKRIAQLEYYYMFILVAKLVVTCI